MLDRLRHPQTDGETPWTVAIRAEDERLARDRVTPPGEPRPMSREWYARGELEIIRKWLATDLHEYRANLTGATPYHFKQPESKAALEEIVEAHERLLASIKQAMEDVK